MKKFLDRYLFSRLGVQIFVSVLVIAIFSVIGTISHNAFVGHKEGGEYQKVMWGFKQVSSTGAAIGTIENLDKIAADAKSESAAPAMLVWSLLSWLVGLVVYSFVTGSIVNAYRNRKAKIDAGLTRYKFKDHGIIIGWDFQGIASVMAMFDIYHLKEVVILSEQPAAKIRHELRQEMDEKSMGKIYIYNGSVGIKANLDSLLAEEAKVIMILGDRNENNNDGGNMRISALVGEHIEEVLKKRKEKRESRIRMFVDVANYYNYALCEKSCNWDWKNIFVRVTNFYASSVYELCASSAAIKAYNAGRRKDLPEAQYEPLAFRSNPEADHVHVIVCGFNEMAKMLVDRIVPLLGAGDREDRITVYAAKNDFARFNADGRFGKLMNVHVDFVASDITGLADTQQLNDIVSDPSASVTLFICDDSPDAALATFNSLPSCLRYKMVRICIEQRMLSRWAWDPAAHRAQGYWNVCFFGFKDRYFASFKMQEDICNRVLGKGDEDHFTEDIYDWTFLEQMYRLGYKLEYVPQGAKELILSDDELKKLVEFGHRGLVNRFVMRGYQYASSKMGPLRQTDEIRQWNDVPDKVREARIEVWRKMIHENCQMLAQGTHPYAFVNRRIRKVFGVVASDLKESRFEVTIAICNCIREQSKTEMDKASLCPACVYTLQGEEKERQSSAVLLNPCDEIGWKVALWAFAAANIKLIFVLPRAVAECAAAIPDETMRRRFDMLVALAHSTIVLPDLGTEGIDKFIRSHADAIIAKNLIQISEPATDVPGVPARICREQFLLVEKDGKWNVELN